MGILGASLGVRLTVDKEKCCILYQALKLIIRPGLQAVWRAPKLGTSCRHMYVATYAPYTSQPCQPVGPVLRIEVCIARG
jgi:hypothetical protein